MKLWSRQWGSFYLSVHALRFLEDLINSLPRVRVVLKLGQNLLCLFMLNVQKTNLVNNMSLKIANSLKNHSTVLPTSGPPENKQVTTRSSKVTSRSWLKSRIPCNAAAEKSQNSSSCESVKRFRGRLRVYREYILPWSANYSVKIPRVFKIKKIK